MEKIKLSNGVEMPVFGLGTCQDVDNFGQTIKDAIDAGYRLFDCTYNKIEIGKALQEKIQQNVVKREDLFIIIRTFNDPDLLQETLKNLQTSYVDLYLMECSEPTKDYLNRWKSLEIIYDQHLSRAIGLSNFNSQQIERLLLQKPRVYPHIKKVECYSLGDCNHHGMKTLVSSPLELLNDTRIQEIATRYQKQPSQILLKYHVQRGNVVTAQASNKKTLLEYNNIFNFYLAPEDMSYINSFQPK